MKIVYVSLCALGMLLGSFGSGVAIEFKAKGSWQLAFDYIDGGNFMGKTRQGAHISGQQNGPMRQSRDTFEALQRLHLQLSAIASESLSGTVFFEIGESRWGKASEGGALGADGTLIKVKHAYMDWKLPNSNLSVRMGIQGIRMPGFSVDNPVLMDDMAGIVASYRFSDYATLTSMWLRPYNDNWTGNATDPANYMDNMDLFALLLPMRGNGFQVTPWVLGGSMGSHALPYATTRERTFSFNYTGSQRLDSLQIRDGLFPAAFSTGRSSSAILNNSYNTMFWGGFAAKYTKGSNLHLSVDAIYGAVDNGRADLNRAGWYGMLLAEYATDFGLPGIYGWYFSGDDGNVHNGSERMPYLTTTGSWANALSTFGYRGNPDIGGGKGVLGANATGTWGLGVRVKNLSFMEDISHVLRVHYFGGTNSPQMASYITGRRTTDGSGRTVYRNNTDFNSFGTYLTTNDTGCELNFDTTYDIYSNLKLLWTVGYIHLWLDKDTWGRYGNISGNSLNYKDAWQTSLNLTYSF